ncbi:Diguanylate cyclase/phosphodiesterase with PAS/PAC sensor(S) [Rhodococcus sp. AW25M09]|uniref:GGDEF domain-containing protein n=1 Tax=Rhodococcus sp. AW25M09 TaxID=1268303 RepID=UPI0002AD12B6|nr:GGDEF domain-containing protein [Rhodococcus sp. AW25M09]CCQ17969.1 Diguanylate cyclase/phosphodiesterase with PAS/PAC sensor(S) [Rhodococcus sp. AW25M09]
MTTRAAELKTPDLHDLIAGTGTATTLRFSIGFGCLNFALIALWVALDTAVGPTSQPARIAVGAAAAAAAVAAVLWASTDKMLNALPRNAFGVFGEFGTGLAILSVPDARDALVGCSLFAVLGAQFTLLMGTRWLTLHLGVAGAVIVATAVRSAQQGSMSISSTLVATYILFVAAVLTPWAARMTWSRLLVYAARSLSDPPTGLLNRSGLEHQLHRLTDPAMRPRLDHFAVVVLDIDNFKSINDSRGHDVGDLVIREVAEMLNDFACAHNAHAARIGGEEFAMLIAKDMQIHLHELGAGCPLSTPGRHGPRATLSAGIVRLPLASADRNTSLATALRSADQLMYRAKRSGGAVAVTEDDRPVAGAAGLEDRE